MLEQTTNRNEGSSDREKGKEERGAPKKMRRLLRNIECRERGMLRRRIACRVFERRKKCGERFAFKNGTWSDAAGSGYQENYQS